MHSHAIAIDQALWKVASASEALRRLDKLPISRTSTESESRIEQREKIVVELDAALADLEVSERMLAREVSTRFRKGELTIVQEEGAVTQ
jgi:hypothetical protein